MRAIAEKEAKSQAAEASFSDIICEESYKRNDIQLQELYLGGTSTGSMGYLVISNMLLTNLSLCVITLSNNDVQDKDVTLFSQSLSRNKLVPLEVIWLLFNKLTCAGVEILMNVIWGSTTLCELRLDNNRINDRGRN